MAKKLRPVQKVTKKELKEDKLVTTFFKAQKYLQEHQANILKIGGGALLVIVISVVWVMSKSKAESQASYELGIAQMKMQQGDPAASADEFSKIADKYRGTASGYEAKLMYAQMKMQLGQIDEALRAYDDFLKHGGKSKYLYPAGLGGKAACLESQSHFDQAVQLYLKAASVSKDLFAAPQFHLDAARCYREVHQDTKAKEQYDLVVSKYAKTPFAEDAQKKLKELGE